MIDFVKSYLSQINNSLSAYLCPYQYKNITDSWRKIVGRSVIGANCDKENSDFDGTTWFRFVEPAGTTLSTLNPQQLSCGTDGIAWMKGRHPIMFGKVVQRTICFSWSGNKCAWSLPNTNVVACKWYNDSEFYLYQLKKPPICALAYCAQ